MPVDKQKSGPVRNSLAHMLPNWIKSQQGCKYQPLPSKLSSPGFQSHALCPFLKKHLVTFLHLNYSLLGYLVLCVVFKSILGLGTLLGTWLEVRQEKR